MKFEYLDDVEIVKTNGDMDGKREKIYGIAVDLGENHIFYIVAMNEMLPNGYKAISMTQHCLKSLEKIKPL